jgi:hypothetical protein
MTYLKQWLENRVEEDHRLYERYGKPLEEAHKGEYLAIGPDGQTILGVDDTEVFRQAIEAFGSGNFGFFRLGYPALEKWLSLNRQSAMTTPICR